MCAAAPGEYIRNRNILFSIELHNHWGTFLCKRDTGYIGKRGLSGSNEVATDGHYGLELRLHA